MLPNLGNFLDIFYTLRSVKRLIASGYYSGRFKDFGFGRYPILTQSLGLDRLLRIVWVECILPKARAL
ncbi:MAG: hypothetical protein AMR96_00055 [Candidatus Adiutrix intracellularis]|nr:MAG: hypothetical protein AMR96_00055 [Candidatus Adiutrix intracellularis]